MVGMVKFSLLKLSTFEATPAAGFHLKLSNKKERNYEIKNVLKSRKNYSFFSHFSDISMVKVASAEKFTLHGEL